jgi:hypothetical protein
MLPHYDLRLVSLAFKLSQLSPRDRNDADLDVSILSGNILLSFAFTFYLLEGLPRLASCRIQLPALVHCPPVSILFGINIGIERH